ncbi:hypothetical protein HKCCSP123_06240 [Rhodobacterales bacterium HKCCSP123]|nr:hypothetical protein [Rhodobacterales bacterium HKCCSP123]
MQLPDAADLIALTRAARDEIDAAIEGSDELARSFGTIRAISGAWSAEQQSEALALAASMIALSDALRAHAEAIRTASATIH